MNLKPHPILDELSQQLPGKTPTKLCIEIPDSFENIALQARKEIHFLENVEKIREEGQSSESFLQSGGYEKWLEAHEDEDRLRVLGTLKLIADLAQELAED